MSSGYSDRTVTAASGVDNPDRELTQQVQRVLGVSSRPMCPAVRFSPRPVSVARVRPRIVGRIKSSPLDVGLCFWVGLVASGARDIGLTSGRCVRTVGRSSFSARFDCFHYAARACTCTTVGLLAEPYCPPSHTTAAFTSH